MMQSLISLLAAFQLACSASLPAENRTVLAMKTGVLLRMHVVAQDDSAPMQHVKICVRDAVRDAYAAAPADDASMLRRTQALLPALTQAAQTAARGQGFTGEVTLSIETRTFDELSLDGLRIPAGEYPALMIRLGDARGHNWWGLIDPELAMSCAELDGSLRWDWSLRGFLAALLGWRAEVPLNE